MTAIFPLEQGQGQRRNGRNGRGSYDTVSHGRPTGSMIFSFLRSVQLAFVSTFLSKVKGPL